MFDLGYCIYLFKAFNIKRTKDPPILIFFNRTTADIHEGDIINFYKMLINHNCKRGLYITTSKFSKKARIDASTRMIELLDSNFLNDTIKKIS